MTIHSPAENVTKVSHGIREDIELGGSFAIDKGSLQFHEGAINLIKAKIEALFEKLEEIQGNQDVPIVRTETVGKVEVIMTSPKKGGLASLREKLKEWKKGKKVVKESDSPNTVVKVSPDTFGEIYIHYNDGEGEKILPVPLTIRLSDKGLDWNMYWTVLSNALGKKYQYARIFSERKS